MAALLKAGAAVDAVDAEGRTPLETAQACGHVKVADFLSQWAPPKQAAAGDAGGDAGRPACSVAGQGSWSYNEVSMALHHSNDVAATGLLKIRVAWQELLPQDAKPIDIAHCRCEQARKL